MKNTGIPYEKLTQRIFHEILNQESVKTLSVEQNIIMKGKTIEHQIDVYWEFAMGPIIYRTVVQAKDWGTSVSQGELLKFKGVIDDLPNQPRGLFVTRTGYQSGAKEYAKANGIILYELREPNESDWEGKIKKLVFRINAAIPDCCNTTIVPDTDWVNETRKSLDLKDGEEIKIQREGLLDEMQLLDEENNIIGTIQSIVNTLIPTDGKVLEPTLMTYHFDTPTYFETNNSRVPKLRISAIESTISMSVITEQFEIDGTEFIGYILKNVIEGTVQTFDKDIKLRKEQID